MAVMGRLAAHFAMSDPIWDRHTNPWSGATRIPIFPLLAFAVYARVWIGWWCLIPVAALLVWTWINPRAFPPPAHTQNWLSQAVLGERVWLNAGAVPIPIHHARAATFLSVLSAVGLIPLIWGLWVLAPWAVAFGCAMIVVSKLWFLDRMVWLFHDMVKVHPPYGEWLR